MFVFNIDTKVKIIPIYIDILLVVKIVCSVTLLNILNQCFVYFLKSRITSLYFRSCREFPKQFKLKLSNYYVILF